MFPYTSAEHACVTLTRGTPCTSAVQVHIQLVPSLPRNNCDNDNLMCSPRPIYLESKHSQVRMIRTTIKALLRLIWPALHLQVLLHKHKHLHQNKLKVMTNNTLPSTALPTQGKLNCQKNTLDVASCLNTVTTASLLLSHAFATVAC